MKNLFYRFMFLLQKRKWPSDIVIWREMGKSLTILLFEDTPLFKVLKKHDNCHSKDTESWRGEE